MNDLLSFHNNAEIKQEYLNRVKAHQAADEIIKGVYWENGKGCAVGCTIHGDNHAAYETELGIPRIIARLEDKIFEGLDNGEAKNFPLEFLEVIPVGVNLNNVWKKFFVWLLINKSDGVLRHVKTDSGREIIIRVAQLMERSQWEVVPVKEWQELRSAADAAADAAAAAADAADAADAAAAADADAAAYAAADAADADAAAAARSARPQHYLKMKNKLLELLHNAAYVNPPFTFKP